MRHAFPALLCILAAAPSLAAEPASPVLGCWENDEDAEDRILLEPHKLTHRQGEEMEFVEARYQPGKIVLDFGKSTCDFQLKDGKLLIIEHSYHRLDKTPPEMRLQPLPLGKKQDLPAEKVKAVQEELARRQQTDQEVRTDPEKQGDMGTVDGENTARLVELVQEVGWIDVSRFGKEASTAAFLIVQHSGNRPLMAAALPEIEKDLKAGIGDPQDFALLYDRLKLYLGERQRYGSQIGPGKDGSPMVLPLEDRKRVEEFRKAIGLFPLATYLQIYARQSGKPVGFSDD